MEHRKLIEHNLANRNLTVDTAKGIGILFVVFGHNWIVKHDPGQLFQVIFSFHVPLFFFMSGFFLKESTDLKQFIVRRADTLLKPYWVILSLMGLIKWVYPSQNPSEHLPILHYFLGVLYGTGPTIGWVALWFLPHLFIASIVAMRVIQKTQDWVGRQVWLAGIAVLFLAIGIPVMQLFWQIDTQGLGVIDDLFFKTHQLPGLPFSLDLVFVSSSLILFGFLCRKKVKSMTFNPILFLSALATFTLLHSASDQFIDLNMRLYSDPIVSSIQAALGIYLVMSASAGLEHYPLLQRSLVYIGSGSLFILIFHTIIQEKVFSGLLQVSHRPYVSGVISFVVAIVLPLLILRLVKRQRLLAALLLPRSAHKLPQKLSSHAPPVV